MSTILDDFATWRFSTFHTPECRAHLEDPGARCICRPRDEDEKPTPHELERSRKDAR